MSETTEPLDPVPDPIPAGMRETGDALLREADRTGVMVNIDSGGEDVVKLVLDMRAELAAAYEALSKLTRFNVECRALLEESLRAPKFTKHLDWWRWQKEHERKVRAVLGKAR